MVVVVFVESEKGVDSGAGRVKLQRRRLRCYWRRGARHQMRRRHDRYRSRGSVRVDVWCRRVSLPAVPRHRRRRSDRGHRPPPPHPTTTQARRHTRQEAGSSDFLAVGPALRIRQLNADAARDVRN